MKRFFEGLGEMVAFLLVFIVILGALSALFYKLTGF